MYGFAVCTRRVGLRDLGGDWGDLRCGYFLILISSLLTKLHTRMQMGSHMPALGIENSTPFYRGGN